MKTQPRKGGRRGRPRKNVSASGDSDIPTTPPATTANIHKDHVPFSTQHSSQADPTKRPREERPFSDFFPHLNIKVPLPIVRVQHALDTSSPATQPAPMPTPAKANKSPPALTRQPTETNSDEFYTGSLDRSTTGDVFTDKTGSEERNADPLIIHHKIGDTFQALSTRPQSNHRSEPLPKPSFRRVSESGGRKHEEQDSDSNRGSSVDQGHRFTRPENHYIRYTEPSESDLFETVEYDMDEQDEMWLQVLNEERQKENAGQVTPDMFEAIMDQLEKEWFDLVKNRPKQTVDEPSLSEDSPCAICDDTECENSNAIVFCDGCNLAVHQDCYGIPYIPEGQWLCRKCLVSPENPVSCLFCPNEGGAFKQTTTNKWGHLLCAIWIPEVGLSNSVYMEPIDNIEGIPKSRWKLTCYLCRRRQGACIQCANRQCFTAFHVTCARWARLCMRMKSHSTHYDDVVFRAYCDKHTPREYREQVDVEQNVLAAQAYFSSARRKHHRASRLPEDKLETSSSGSDYEQGNQTRFKKRHRNKSAHHEGPAAQLLSSSKAARAHQHHYAERAPIAPEYVIHKLENVKLLRQATHLHKKAQLLTSISRYWSLKRESRRGAPLLKRLHLEPWTASSQHKQNEVEKALRAKAMMNLRSDLELVRMLSEQVQKREKLKLERLRKQKLYLETIFFPVEYVCRPAVEHLMEGDKMDLFRYPVTPDVAPDYADVIEHPMCFSDILEKMAAHVYTSIDEIEADVMLIWHNSMVYNRSDTTYYRLAQKLENLTKQLFNKVRQDFAELEISKTTGILATDIHPEIFTYNMVQVPSPEEILAERRRLADEARERLAAQETQGQKHTEETKKEAKEEEAMMPVTRRSQRQVQGHRQHQTVARSVGTRKTRATESLDAPASPPSRRHTRSMGSGDLAAPIPEHSEIRSNEIHDVKDVGRRVSRKRKASQGGISVESEGESTDTKTDKATKEKGTDTRSVPAPALRKSKRVRGILHTHQEPPVRIKHNQIVWARVKGFPPHPASIVDPKQQQVAPKIVAAQPKSDMVLVEFFKVPEMHQWGWVARSEVHVFGHPQLDTEMLIIARKTKKSHRIKEILRGYQFACELVGTDPQPQIDAAFGRK